MHSCILSRLPFSDWLFSCGTPQPLLQGSCAIWIWLPPLPPNPRMLCSATPAEHVEHRARFRVTLLIVLLCSSEPRFPLLPLVSSPLFWSHEQKVPRGRTCHPFQ